MKTDTDDTASIVSTAFTSVGNDGTDRQFLFVKSEDLEVESDVEDDHFISSFTSKSKVQPSSENGEDWDRESSESDEDCQERSESQKKKKKVVVTVQIGEKNKKEMSSNGKNKNHKKKVSEITPEERKLEVQREKEAHTLGVVVKNECPESIDSGDDAADCFPSEAENDSKVNGRLNKRLNNDETSQEKELQLVKRPRRRSARQAKLLNDLELEAIEKSASEENTDSSSEEDSTEEEDEESEGMSGESKGKLRRKRVRAPGIRTHKRVSEMTPEELEKKREQWRRETERRKERRAKQREQRRLELNQSQGDQTDKIRTHKRVSEMTPEELEKKREQWRRETERRKERRAKQREQRQLEIAVKVEQKEKLRTHKRVSEMTPEELEKKREQWRRDTERRRERQAKQRKQNQLEQNKIQWKKKKTVAEMTPEELERARANWRRKEERKKQALSNMAPDEFEAEKERQRILRMNRRANLSAEELERRRAYDRERARMSRQRMIFSMMPDMTPELLEQRMEEWKEKRKKELEEKAKIPKNLPEGKKLEEMTPEEKQRWKIMQREAKSREYARRKRLERKQWSEEQKKEFSDKQKLYHLERKARMTEAQLAEERMRGYMRYLNRMAKMTPEELEEYKKKKKEYKRKRKMTMTMTTEQLQRRRKKTMQRETVRKRRQRMAKSQETLEEKKRRYQANKVLKRRTAIQEMMSKGMTPEEISAKLETPEQREKRLHKMRVKAAQRSARKKLMAAGASEEEIEAQLKDIEENYVSKRALRAPKVCPERWVEIRPSHELPIKNSLLEKVTKEKEKAKSPASVKGPLSTVSFPEDTQYGDSSEVNSNFSLEQQTQVQLEPEKDVQYQDNQQETFDSHVKQQTLSYSYQHEPPQPTQFKCDSPEEPPTNIEDPDWNYDSESADSSAFVEVPQTFPAPTQSQHPPTYFNTSEPDSGKRKRGRPRKNDVSSTSTSPTKKKGCTTLPCRVGRQFRKDTVRDAVCDECGNAYSSGYLNMHKNLVHHPDFKNGKCLVCGETFKHSKLFYAHWKKEHSTHIRAPSKRSTTDPDYFSRIKYTSVVCDTCGNTYSSKGSLDLHWHTQHGPGSLRENFLKCELCPPDKKKSFKIKAHLVSHMERKHGCYNNMKCLRCPEMFRNLVTLNAHLQQTHPESYWPCKFCGTVRFSVWGLNLHVSTKQCTKISLKDWAEWRKDPQNVCFQFIPLPCEFCNLNYKCRSLKQHYRVIHNACEDKFKCFTCEKEFARREHWGVHMLEFHNMDFEDCKEKVSKLFVQDRSKLNIIMETKKKFQSGNKRSNRKKKNSNEEEELDMITSEEEASDENDCTEEVKRGSQKEEENSGNKNEKCSDKVDVEIPGPCPFCSMPMNTKIGLDFHIYTQRCTKVIRSEWNKWTDNPNNLSFDRFGLECEICNKTIVCQALSIHYKKVHKVTENKRKCLECEREFSQRQTWGVHMIEDHSWDVEEVKEHLRKVNVDAATKAEVLKAALCASIKAKKKKHIDSEEEDQCSDNSSASPKGKGRKRRKKGSDDSEDENKRYRSRSRTRTEYKDESESCKALRSAARRVSRRKGTFKVYNEVDESEDEVGQSDTVNKNQDIEEDKNPWELLTAQFDLSNVNMNPVVRLVRLELELKQPLILKLETSN